MVIGIDPGSTTGIAVLKNGVLVYCKQFAKGMALAICTTIATDYKCKYAAIEVPRYGVLYNRPWYKKAKGMQVTNRFGCGAQRISISDYKKLSSRVSSSCNDITAGQIKLAQNIGQNIETTHRFIGKLEDMGIKVMRVVPKARRKGQMKTTKWPVDTWQRIFNWDRRPPGEHARDAAIIAYLNEGRARQYGHT